LKDLAKPSRRSLGAELEQSQAEIESAWRQLLDGHPDIHGLVLAMADWAEEERIIRGQQGSGTNADSNPESGGQPRQEALQR
jgi:hypothetical protein